MRRETILALLLLAVLTVGVFAVRVGIKPHESAPDFTLTDLKGKKVSLSDYRGQGVVLNFWSTWCSPCRAELPDFQKEHQNAKGFVILTVNLQEDEKTVQNFMNKGKYTFPVLLDKNGKVAQRYQVQGIPTTFFIDKQGVIQDVKVGALSASQLKAKIKLIK